MPHVEKTCGCGATLTVDGIASFVAARAREFDAAHADCPGRCPAPPSVPTGAHLFRTPKRDPA